jgi:hypothetical protein
VKEEEILRRGGENRAVLIGRRSLFEKRGSSKLARSTSRFDVEGRGGLYHACLF